MVNLLVYIIFLVSYIPLAAVCFLLLDQNLALVFMAVLLLGWGTLYLYLDKFVLIVLKAREIINTDEQELFQILKNQSYKFHEFAPKVYLYNSQLENFFVFESRGQWSLIVSRKLMAKLDHGKKEAIAEFAYLYKKTKMTKLKTKCLGLSLIYQLMIHKLSSYLYELTLITLILFLSSFVSTLWLKIIVGLVTWIVLFSLRWIWIKFFQFSRDEEFKRALYKSFFIFLSFLTKPFFIPIEAVLNWSVKIPVQPSLKPFYFISKEKKQNTDKLMTNIIVTDRRFEELVVKYIENFPLILDCEFKNEF